MYLTINSTFKPFTYEELSAPLKAYGAAYKEMEEKYSDLASQTEAWKNIVTQENSPEAYAMYKKYSNDLNAMVEDFSHGMNRNNRSKYLGLKSRYESEIGAIDKAYKAMQAANLYRDTVKTKDNTAIFNTDRYTSIDDFLHGEIADNNYISGEQLETSLLSKVYAEANAKFTELTSKGMSDNNAIKKITSGEAFDIDSIVDEELKNLNVQNYDAAGQEKLRTYINSGVIKGFGSFVDKQTLTAEQRASNAIKWATLAEQKRQFNLEWYLNKIKLEKPKSLNIDSTLYFTKDGTVFKRGYQEVVQEKLISYEDAKKDVPNFDKHLEKAYGTGILKNLPVNSQFFKTTLENGTVTYRLYVPEKTVEIEKVKEEQDTDYDPDDF